MPDELRGRYSEFGARTVVRITVDRRLFMRDSRLVPMDFASPFFTDLIEFAKSPAFKGEYANLAGPALGILGIYKIRWQNDQGRPRWEALVPVFLPKDQETAIPNPQFFGSLLLYAPPSYAHPSANYPEERRNLLRRLSEVANDELGNRCTRLRHPNDVILLAAADLTANSAAP